VAGVLLLFFGAMSVAGPAGPLMAQRSGGPGRAPDVVIAVVRDGPPVDEDIAQLIDEELGLHLPPGTRVTFKTDPSFDAGWQPGKAATVLGNALADPETDLVLAVGSLVTVAAARDDVRLTKPVVSTFIQRADVFRLPYTEGDRSLKENLSFMVIPQRVERDFEAFRRLVSFRTLVVLAAAEDLEMLGDVSQKLADYRQRLGIEMQVHPVTPDVDDALVHLPEGTEAIYLTRMPRLSREDRSRLIEGLGAREIPTFSMLGRPDVEMGALAALTPDIQEQVVRRVAINLSRLGRGASASDLPVLLSVDTRLLINARTAVQVGYLPDVETRMFATLLHPEALEEEVDELLFADALARAEQSNTALSVRDSQVESADHDQDRARSVLLPQLSADVDYLNTGMTMSGPLATLAGDSDFSASAVTGSVTLRQILYDDGARSAYRISTERFRGTEWERETQRLDVLAEAGQAYIDLGLSEALYRIRADNLRLTEDFLELARLRRDVGYSGREEIVRWESSVAEGRSDLFRSEQNVEGTRIRLNQVLAAEQHRRWRLEEPAVDPDVFPFLGGRLDEVFDDYEGWQALRDTLVEMALANAPELQALDRAVQAQQIQLDERKRRYWLPTFFADLSYADRISRSGDEILFPEEDFYTIFVGLNYPIYEGGRKGADVRRATSDLQGLERQRRFVEEKVEQRARTAMRAVENSFPRIKFSGQSAQAAGENLELVSDKYAEGLANVTDLLEAQNQKFSADQFATINIYEFFLDLVAFQRAIAWFEEDKTAEEQDRLVQEIRSAVATR
jgi:outer membrane protein TolC